MWALTTVFLEVISSCEVVLSSSLGLQFDNFEELNEPEVVKVLRASFPKFKDSLGFFPAIGVPELLHDGEGILRIFDSVDDGIKSESLLGAGRFWFVQRDGGRERAGRRGRTVRAVILDY